MRTRSTLAVLVVLAAATACVRPVTTGSAPVSSASATPTDAPSEEPTASASATPTAEPSGATELDYTLQANFGSVELSAAFTPDPHSVGVTSGGPIDVAYLGTRCVGWATAAPDYEVTYTAVDAAILRFYFVANEAVDTTLIVNAPNGDYVCGDDYVGTIDPAVDFDNPASGQYDVWVGSYDQGAEHAGILYVTEMVDNHP
jgi:hypothetical protein